MIETIGQKRAKTVAEQHLTIECLTAKLNECKVDLAIANTELALKTKRINELSRVTEVVMKESDDDCKS